MSRPQPQTIFLAGTDTDVGKTYTAALIAQSLRHSGVNVGVYKPVASGCRFDGDVLVADDAVKLWESAGKPGELAAVCPQKFIAPLAPPQAAILEGKTVDVELLYHGAQSCYADAQILLLEGAGGLFSPLGERFLNIDLVKRFDAAKLIIVAANRLGAIHQTLATCTASLHHGVKPAGIVLCSTQPSGESSTKTNAREIAKYTDVPVLGEIDFGASELSSALAKLIVNAPFYNDPDD